MIQVQHPARLGFLVVAALVTTVVFLRSRTPAPEPARARLDIGYYVRDARVMGTGSDGRALYWISAAEARQDLGDGSVQLDGIAVKYDPATDVPWELTARGGHIPPGGNIIILTGDVVAQTPTAAPPTLIRTDYLELDPDSYVARTAREVTIERARDTLRARGMRVDFRADRVQLEAAVQGNFQP